METEKQMETQNTKVSVAQETGAQASTKNSPNLMIIMPVIIIVVAIIAGTVWFISTSRTSEPPQSRAPQSPQAQTTASSIESELNAIDIESNDPNFADVDRDLQSL